jgi:Cu/Ag efflux protein CusF
MKHINTLIKWSHCSLLALAIAAVTFSAVPARAHDGMEDVTGTIQSVADSSISVKTTKGKVVSIKLDAKTEYTRGKAQAKLADIKTGDRVVVHAKEEKEVLTAHLVQLPTVTSEKSKK